MVVTPGRRQRRLAREAGRPTVYARSIFASGDDGGLLRLYRLGYDTQWRKDCDDERQPS
jgi:hypothetical protein